MNILKRKNEAYYTNRKALGDYNYGKRIPGTEKCQLRGVCPLPNGEFYFGEWLEEFEVMQGKGMLIDKQGFLFEGWFINDQIVTGRYIWSDSYTYTGQFRDFKAHGSGTAYYKNGSRYDGQWKQGAFDGQGSYFYLNGDFWQGDWKAGSAVAVGVHTSKNDTAVSSNFKGYQK